jgi:glutamate racemase
VTADRNAPIGVFDSGLGGLTVVRALRQSLPAEHIVYLGDTARVPYGTKGAATVVKYAMSCAQHLVARGVKALVVACNTVSAVATERLRIELDVPILGVIEPGARAAVAATRTGRIGVLATTGTIASGAYPRAVTQVSTRAEVIGQAAPLLVPLAEEGWTEGDVPRLVVRRYLEPLSRAEVDVVVLGCTHYPLLRTLIEEEVRTRIGEQAMVVDSASATASDVRAFLEARGLSRQGEAASASVSLLVTDVPRTFRETAARFLGSEIGEVEQVDL